MGGVLATLLAGAGAFQAGVADAARAAVALPAKEDLSPAVGLGQRSQARLNCHGASTPSANYNDVRLPAGGPPDTSAGT